MFRERNASKFFSVAHAVSFIVLATAIILTVNVQQRKRALAEAEDKAQILLQYNLSIHTYFSKQLKPKVFELTDATRGSFYFEPAWMSSTYAVREIDKYYKQLSNENYYYKECAVNARSPENEADEYEKSFIDDLMRNRTLTQKAAVRGIAGKPFFVLMRRGESMEAGCLRCHSQPAAAPGGLVQRYGPTRSFNRKDGDLVSAVSIRIPLEEAYSAANLFSLKLSVLLLFILGIVYGIQHFLASRLLLRPLSVIRDRVIAIQMDETKLGDEIQVSSLSKEVNDLTRAFNGLSHDLRAEKDGLVSQVHLRTQELSQKVTELEAALTQVRRLEGIIPICSCCKKIRDDQESWHQLESYISEHSDASFSHGYCPDCMQKQLEMIEKTITPAPDPGNL